MLIECHSKFNYGLYANMWIDRASATAKFLMLILWEPPPRLVNGRCHFRIYAMPDIETAEATKSFPFDIMTIKIECGLS